MNSRMSRPRPRPYPLCASFYPLWTPMNNLRLAKCFFVWFFAPDFSSCLSLPVAMCAVKFPRLYAKKSSPTDAFTNWPENVHQLRWLRSDPWGTTFYLRLRHRCWFAHTPWWTTMSGRPYLPPRNRWSLSRWRDWVKRSKSGFRCCSLRVEVVRQSGQQAPSKLSEREWGKVLTYQSRNARLRYYRYVFDAEIDWKCGFKESISQISQSRLGSC